MSKEWKTSTLAELERIEEYEMSKELVAMVNNPTDEDLEAISDAVGEKMKELGLTEEDSDGESED